MKLVVGISGASGSIYGVRLLEELNRLAVDTHLVISRWGRENIERETGRTVEAVRALASVSHEEGDLAAPIASGSYRTDGMIVAPCSAKTLSAIANGYCDNLIARAADVTVKEGRRLVLMVREAPLSAIHLENMLKLARLGVVIFPPVPAFYARSRTVDELVLQSVGRVLDGFGLLVPGFRRWAEE